MLLGWIGLGFWERAWVSYEAIAQGQTKPDMDYLLLQGSDKDALDCTSFSLGLECICARGFDP